MQAQRDHLNRNAGDVEIGVADILRAEQAGANGHQAAHLPSPPAWLQRWEKRRPPILVECFAEFLGVGVYVFCGTGATATLLITTAVRRSPFPSRFF
ncbi:hypothetical protein JCM3766R1_001587, partial [Sporobolomyces carnicolor]